MCNPVIFQVVSTVASVAQAEREQHRIEKQQRRAEAAQAHAQNQAREARAEAERKIKAERKWRAGALNHQNTRLASRHNSAQQLGQ